MPKINKVYPPFFNGVSQQSAELILDNQCKEMTNCVPDIIRGLKKRPPVRFRQNKDYTTYPEMEAATVFHTYDRGEDDEEYIFVQTEEATDPVLIFNKAGEQMTVEYEAANETEVKDYLAQGNLKGLTVQDRSWVYSKNATTTIDTTNTTALDPDYEKVAYYWLKRSAGDRYNPYNYAVYLDGVAYACNPDKPAQGGPDAQDPPTGFENSDYAAAFLARVINSEVSTYSSRDEDITPNTTRTFSNIYIGKDLTNVSVLAQDPQGNVTSATGVSYNSTTGYISYSIYNNLGDLTLSIITYYKAPSYFTAEVVGSILKIYRSDNEDFTYSSWDSWGNQASEGWKGTTNKISDLPNDMPFDDVYVKIEGSSNDEFTEHYVKWTGSSWAECADPAVNRGQLANMPVKCDRISFTNGVATFKFDLIEWSQPIVGNTDNNPDPSFANQKISDMFFYKNRLGMAAEDSVSLSESANYVNFYATTALDVVETDMIDITVASNKASRIYYVKPFNNSLYIFTKYSQYELVSEGAFSPATVSLANTTNYPINIYVEPIVVNDSLYFVSTTNNRQQLREYIKTESLNVKGVDLSISTPTYLDDPIVKIVADGVLGFILCCTASNKLYFYNYKEDGQQRIQSSWSSWEVLNGLDATNFEYFTLGSDLLIMCKTEDDYRYHYIELDTLDTDGKVDQSNNLLGETIDYPYESSVLLPDFYPKLGNIRTPLNKVLVKKVTIQGEGSFDVEIYRKDYNHTFFKSHDQSLKDLDVHLASKVGKADITIKDSSTDDFVISSIIVEGLFSTTSKELN